MPTISFSGLSSGLDTDSLMEALLDAERIRGSNMEIQKANWETKLAVVEEIDNQVGTLLSSLGSLRSASSFFSRQAESSNEGVLGVAVDSTVQDGSYSVTVAGATKHIFASAAGVSDPNSGSIAEQDGTLVLEDGQGNTINVGVTAGMTMQELADAITTALADAGSGASVDVFNDGSSTNPWRLQITAGEAGASHQINVKKDPTILNFNGTGIDTLEIINNKESDEDLLASGGYYTGHVNKRFVFNVTSGGTIGEDEIEISWKDTVEGRSGNFIVDGEGSYEIVQGVTVDITGDGQILEEGTTFSIDVFTNKIQQAQDDGLARTEKEAHSGHADTDLTPVTNTDGTFSYSYAGVTIDPINVKAGTTLSELASLINSDADNPGVQATIVNDGLGLANSYHLVLSGDTAGTANKIENISYNLDNFESAQGFSETQQATNAMFRVNDYPVGDKWLQRNSNLVTDAVDGMSITLKEAGSTTISVSNDNDAMVEKVREFVDAYNGIMDYLTKITAINETGSVSMETASDAAANDTDEDDTDVALFAGDYSVRMMQSRLSTLIVTQPDGFDNDSDPYLLLSQLGITTGDEYQLEFDEDKLRQALNANPDEVVKLFSADREGSTDSSYLNFVSGLSTSEGGLYEVRSEYDTDGNFVVAKYRVNNSDTWYNMTEEEDGTLTATSGPARGLAVTSSWDGVSTTQTSMLNLRVGKANQVYEDLSDFFDSEDGITKVMSKTYESTIEDLAERIEREERRVSTVEERLRNQFNNLEVAMTELNGQQEQLSSLLGSLSASV